MQQTSSMAARPLPIPVPPGRSSLYVKEVAALWRCSGKHVSDLIEEGKLGAVDIKGGDQVFEAFITEVARALKWSPARVRALVDRARRKMGHTRRYWRIPVDQYAAFLNRHMTKTLDAP